MIKKPKWVLLITSIGIALVFYSCAPTPVVIQKPSNLPSYHMIEKVHQIHQGRNECGPASVAMVLNYYGVNKKKDELKDDLRWHPEKGIPYQNMLRFPFEQYGFKVDFVKKGSIEQLIEQISQNRPVIVRQWLNSDAKFKGDMGHWRVVIGFNHEKEKIYMRDPAITMKGFSSLSYREFLELWDLSHHSNPSKNLTLILIPDKKGE